jgi:single-strand selective monofunctional uracil DNA glycosylase
MSDELIGISQRLRAAVGELSFGEPVTHVYNPLQYAWETHRDFLARFGGGRGRVVLLGMNPGPFGMAQTGVPFGEIAAVRDWMKIRGQIGVPAHEHPKRRVQGFDCPRSEVSGRRLWSWAQEDFGTPEAFFERFFVLNYCPLSFMESSGKNRIPEKLSASERKPLFEACDRALIERIALLEPRRVIGVGGFAEKRAKQVLERVPIGRVLHPSPASPAANRGWKEAAVKQLREQGVLS